LKYLITLCNNDKYRWKKIFPASFRAQAKTIGSRRGKRRAVGMNHARRWTTK